MESRVKTWVSIAEKLERRGLDLEGICALSDFIGVRTILLFRTDLMKALDLVREHFDVFSNENTGERLSDSEFGYQSQHLLMRIPEAWQKLPTMEGLRDFSIELQVRTLAQHIWAAASHKLQYKQEAGVPRPVRRSINRVAALLETVDLEFERVLEERKIYADQVPAPDEPLNVDNLAALLDEMLPSANKKEPEPYEDLLEDLTKFGIKTTGQLRAILSRRLEATLKHDSEAVKEYANNPSFAEERRSRGVYFAHVGLVRVSLQSEFGDTKYFAIMRSQVRKRSKRKRSTRTKKK